MGGRAAQELALLGQAGQALAEARNIDQIKEIRDKAEAVRKYAQSASLGLDIQNRAAEVKLRAERQAGKLLAEMVLRGGDRRSKNHRERLNLDDLGISRNQSTRWQMQARVPDDVFQDHIRETCQAGKELTSSRLIRIARHWNDSNDGEPASAGGRGKNGDDKSEATQPQHRDHRTPTGTFAEITSELINHHQLLDNILRPIYSGESESLVPAERRVMRYLLLESQKQLARLQKLQLDASACMCHADRER